MQNNYNYIRLVAFMCFCFNVCKNCNVGVVATGASNKILFIQYIIRNFRFFDCKNEESSYKYIKLVVCTFF